MKKILFMFVALISVLGIANKVVAAEAICVYPLNSFENANYFTVTIKDNKISVSYSAMSSYVKINSTLVANNFIDSNNQLECLNKITYSVVSDRSGATYTVSHSSGAYAMKLDSSMSNVTNDAPGTQPGEETEKTLLKCSYSNNFLIKTDKQVNVELANGYTLTSKPSYDEIGDSCPEVIYMTCTTRGGNYCSVSLENNLSATKYILDSKVQDADNLNNPEESEEDNEYISGSNDLNININYEGGCGIFSESIKNWLTQVLDIIKIAALVLTLILGMLDFFKGVASGNADAMKKMWKNFSTRLIVVAVLFLLPVIIEFLLGLVTINGIDSSNPLCGIK